MKHTPGPWKYLPEMLTHENQPVIYSTTCDRLMTPVAIATGVLDPDGPEDAMDKIIADAYLIAAAPELLECCKFWLEFMRMSFAREDTANMQMTISAIAKAEGKT